MQNKGIVIVLAVLMTLASIFYLSFSVATSYYDSEAAKIKDPIAQQDYKDSVKYLGVYEGNNRGYLFKQEFAILSDGTLCEPDAKYDEYKRVNDNTWGYFAGNVEDYMIMDESGNISEHFYINDAKNKGIDQGGIIYTKLSD